MENKYLIDKILNATRSSVEMERSSRDSCGLYSMEDFFHYWDGDLDRKDSVSMESHCMECSLCAVGMEKAKDIIEQADKISDAMDDNIPLYAAQKHMDRYEANMLWAAKGKPSGYNGEANGIAISEEGDMAKIIRCIAYIDKDLNKNGQIDICGTHILKTPDGAETRSPLDSLEEKLKGPLMAIPFFRAFNLHRRYINIDIGECHLIEAWSLSLAIVMSLINGLCQRKDDAVTIYSANIVSNGALEPVEKISQKVFAARKKGIRRFILSSKNRHDIPQELLDDPDFEVLFFDDLEQVIRYFELPSLQLAEDSINPSSDNIDDCDIEQTCDIDENDTGWASIAKKMEDAGAGSLFINRIFPFLEKFCQSPPIKEGRCLTLVIGDIERITKILPAFLIEIAPNKTLFEFEAAFHELGMIFNRKNFAFAIGNKGEIHSVRRTDIDLQADNKINPLFIGHNRRLAAISMLSGSTIFFISQTGRYIHIFQGGKSIGRYINGGWQETRYEKFRDLLRKISKAHNINKDTIFKIACSSLAVAERGVSCVFAIGVDENDYVNLFQSSILDNELISQRPISIKELQIEDLIDFTVDNGAVLIDQSERVRFGEIQPLLRPSSNKYQGMETAQEIGRQYSKLTDSIVIVSSTSRTVTLFDKGEELICC